MRWLNKWFSFSWKKLALVAALVPVMWVFNSLEFQKVDAFVRDSLQFLNSPTNVEKSLVTININWKDNSYPRPLRLKDLKDVIQSILAQNPKQIVLCLSPLEIDGTDVNPDIRKELFDYLMTEKNVYVYSNARSDRDDMAVDNFFAKFPRIFMVTMITDNSNNRKHRRAIVSYEKTGDALEFAEIKKLGFKTKSPDYFRYGWHFWNTNQPYLKTYPQKTFGSFDARDLIESKFRDLNLKDKTVLLGTADEYSMLATESVFNLILPVGRPGYKDFPTADSLANYINFYIHGDYMKLVKGFYDVLWITLILILIVFINIDLKKKLIIFISIIPALLLIDVLVYWISSFYINFSKSIASVFILQYLGIPIFAFAIFKEQESKKLQEINDARIDALFTVSEKVAHDIRSPLSAINLVAEKAVFPDSEYKEIFDGAIKRIDETASKILTQYRTKTGRENEELKKVPLVEIINEITNEKKILNDRIDFEIVSNLTQDEVLAVRLDIERIVSNILDNSIFALKAILDPKILIAIEDLDKMVRLSISDNGTGIPEQILKAVGVERITTKADSNLGNGIGLLHAKRVIERFNGKFEVASKELVGTTIIISLPKA